MGIDLWSFEKKAFQKGFSRIAGIDEAGRGPLAGPVVSAAVIIPTSIQIPEISDSKKLTPKKRYDLYEKIYDLAVSVGIGIVDPFDPNGLAVWVEIDGYLLHLAPHIENLLDPFEKTVNLRWQSLLDI